jgi:hypothetical protein
VDVFLFSFAPARPLFLSEAPGTAELRGSFRVSVSVVRVLPGPFSKSGLWNGELD